MRKPNPIRTVKPEQLCIGDTIRVTRKHKDVTISETGTVADRQHYTHSTEYVTSGGHVLVEAFHHEKFPGVIKRLYHPGEEHPTLIGLDFEAHG